MYLCTRPTSVISEFRFSSVSGVVTVTHYDCILVLIWNVY